MRIDLTKLPEYYLHFIAFCSLASNVLAVFERAVNLNFPDAPAQRWLKFANDLISGFGALNFRDRIVNGSATSKEKANAAASGD